MPPEEIMEEKLEDEEPSLEAPEEETPVETPEETAEEQPAEQPQEEPAEQMVDWSKYSDKYDGRNLDDVLGYYRAREQQYGQQANELGRLRQVEQQWNQTRQQLGRQPEKRPELSEAENQVFLQRLQTDPAGAIQDILVPKLTEQIQRSVLQNVSQNIAPVLSEQVQNVVSDQEWNSFTGAHPDFEEHKGMMDALMAPDYLGDQARYEDVYSLAVIARDEKALFPTTCGLMRCGVPFAKAKHLATCEREYGTKSKNQKEQIKQEVNQISPGVKRPGTKQKTSEPEIVTMDDAFAPD